MTGTMLRGTRQPVPAGFHTSHDAAELAGITYRQLDYWTRRGWIRPTHTDGLPGSGHGRLWTDDDVAALVTVAARLFALDDALARYRRRLRTGAAWDEARRGR